MVRNLSAFSFLVFLLLETRTFAHLQNVSCSSTPILVPRVENHVDISWVEYSRSVYGPNAPIVNKDHVNVLFKNGPVRVKVYGWTHHRPLSALPSTWGETYLERAKTNYSSYTWVEVVRYSTQYLNTFKASRARWAEGLSVGFPGRGYNATKVAYGCWFHSAKGSGIYVNTGRTYAIGNKYSGDELKNLGLLPNGCWPFDLEYTKIVDSCFDRNICSAALKKGFDSVQFIDRDEIVICGGSCATRSLTGACPREDIPLQRGFPYHYGPTSGLAGSRDRCLCDDRSYLLNCGNHTTDYPLGSHVMRAPKRPVPVRGEPRHFTCVDRRHLIRPDVDGIKLSRWKNEMMKGKKGKKEKKEMKQDFRITINFIAGLLKHDEVKRNRILTSIERMQRLQQHRSGNVMKSTDAQCSTSTSSTSSSSSILENHSHHLSERFQRRRRASSGVGRLAINGYTSTRSRSSNSNSNRPPWIFIDLGESSVENNSNSSSRPVGKNRISEPVHHSKEEKHFELAMRDVDKQYKNKSTHVKISAWGMYKGMWDYNESVLNKHPVTAINHPKTKGAQLVSLPVEYLYTTADAACTTTSTGSSTRSAPRTTTDRVKTSTKGEDEDEKDLIVGIVAFSPLGNAITRESLHIMDDDDEEEVVAKRTEFVRSIIDQAMCVRSLGAELVILMGGDYDFNRLLADHVTPYVDVILGTGVVTGVGAGAQSMHPPSPPPPPPPPRRRRLKGPEENKQRKWQKQQQEAGIVTCSGGWHDAQVTHRETQYSHDTDISSSGDSNRNADTTTTITTSSSSSSSNQNGKPTRRFGSPAAAKAAAVVVQIDSDTEYIGYLWVTYNATTDGFAYRSNAFPIK